MNDSAEMHDHEASDATPAPQQPAAATPTSDAPPPATLKRAPVRQQTMPTGVPPAALRPSIFERDSHSVTALGEVMDRATHAAIARTTGGLSPASLAGAWADWLLHLSLSPGKQLQLGEKAYRKWLRLARFTAACMLAGGRAEPCIDALPQDRRFRDPKWEQWPFNVAYQSFLLSQQWWHNATLGVPGVTQQHERVLEFASRQMLDVFSPSNWILTNPVVLQRTQHEAGRNLARGFQNWLEDCERLRGSRAAGGLEAFRPGHEVAATPGKVVYRNRLIELIQYAPATDAVHPEPILIVPAWIMKYYILDLSPHNSLVRHLVENGFTVFMISWLNPTPEDRELSMDDYRTLGVMDALSAVGTIVPERKVHGVGYCLGGTLLAIAAAALARTGDEEFASLSFFASQIDFTEAGELQLFITESQLAFLEDMMWEQGFLDTKQMAGTFQMLRSNDLIWSRLVHEYLMGERAPPIDLMAWNADATRMPYRMHSEYLRRLYLNNDLAEGRYFVDGQAVSVADITAPVFAVGTTSDHVAPWRSVHKMHLHLDTELTFVLTNGGHNAGIVAEPGHPRRQYRISTVSDQHLYLDAEAWLDEAVAHEGSWWPAWVSWLADRSGACASPPTMGNAAAGYAPMMDAPGRYVLVK